MKYVTRNEFEQRFPRKESDTRIDTIFPGNLSLDRDSSINGLVKGDVTIKSGAQALITGIVHGNLEVEADSVLFLYGVVKGDIKLAGSAFVTGIVGGQITGTADAWVYVP